MANSLDRAVRVLYRTYPALVTALEHEATSNATAKGLLHEVQQYKFIMLTHLLLDILPVLTSLHDKICDIYHMHDYLLVIALNK